MSSTAKKSGSARKRKRSPHKLYRPDQQQHQLCDSGDNQNVFAVPAAKADSSSSPTAAVVSSNDAACAASLTTSSSMAAAIVNETNANITLINKVKEHQVLYNPGECNKDTKKRENTWKKVADELGVSVYDAKLRWKRLRDNFRVAIKRTNELNMKVDSPFNEGTLWRYQKEMEFLLPFTQIKGNPNKEMLKLEHLLRGQPFNYGYFGEMGHGSCSFFNNNNVNESHDHDKISEPPAEEKEMIPDRSSDSRNCVDEGFLYPDVELFYPNIELLSDDNLTRPEVELVSVDDSARPNASHGNPTRPEVELVSVGNTTAAIADKEVTDSSAQLRLGQQHPILRSLCDRQQQKPVSTNVHAIDLFFYSMAASTKLLPLPAQLLIKRVVLSIVSEFEKKNMNLKKKRG